MQVFRDIFLNYDWTLPFSIALINMMNHKWYSRV
jgi:hypothetical protein